MSIAGFLKNLGTRPSGLAGFIAGRLMNTFGTGRYISTIAEICGSSDFSLLDTGCGGGKFLQRMHHQYPGALLAGIDHSPEMARLSSRVNKKGIKDGSVSIKTASVTELPFIDRSFDIVTAFDTIQFWPDYSPAMHEILRVLRPGGTFLILNQYPQPGSAWYEQMQIRDADQYWTILDTAGFSSVKCDEKSIKRWIIVKAVK